MLACSSKKPAEQKPLIVNKPATSSTIEEAEALFFEAQKEKLTGNTEAAYRLFVEVAKKNPKNDAAFYEMGRIDFEAGLFNKAIPNIDQAIKISPKIIWYHLLQAELFSATNQPKKAVESYRRAIALDNTTEELYLRLANEQVKSKNLQEALQTIQQLEKQIGLSPESVDVKVTILRRKGENQAALEALKVLVAQFPLEPAYQYQLGVSYLELKQYANALKHFETVNALAPEFGEGWFYRFVSLIELSRYQETKELLEQMALNPDLQLEVKLNFFAPILLMGNNDFPDKPNGIAIAALLVNAHPNEAIAYGFQADVYLKEDKLKEAETALAIAVTKPDASQQFQIWQQYLAIMMQNDAYNELITQSNAALELFPNQVVVYFYKGLAQLQLSKHAEAIKTLEQGLFFVANNKELESQFFGAIGDAYHALDNHTASDKAYINALKANPNNALVLNNYSYYLAERGESLNEAYIMSKRAIELEPNMPSYLDTYAWVLYKLKRYKEALTYIDMAIAIDQNAVHYEHKGDILFRLEEVGLAVKFWQKALELNPENEKIKQKINARKIQD